MAAKRVVHIIGTGTIGEPLIGLFLNLRQQLELDEVTFHKNRPLLSDRAKVKNLIRRGAKLVVAAETMRELYLDDRGFEMTRPQGSTAGSAPATAATLAAACNRPGRCTESICAGSP